MPYNSRTIFVHLQISRLFTFDAFEVEIGYRRYDQREFLDRDIGWIEPKTSFLRQAQLFQPEIKLHDHPLMKRQLIVLAQEFFHHDELEISDHIVPLERFIPAGHIHFPVNDQVFDYFAEHPADLWLNPEAQPELYPDNIVGNNVIDAVFRGVRIIYRIHMYKPIDVGALRLFVQNGIDD